MVTLLGGEQEKRNLYGELKLRYNGASTETFVVEEEKYIEKRGSANGGVTALLHIPFYPPFLKEHIDPFITIEYGPVRWQDNSREVYLTEGNAFGPLIAITMEGFFY